ncbi:GTPase HflX [Planomicrobium sp. YIM 101495]|uniref:GTPase HflX n=1 Tax=Planomicrobium sp. YIM 101495 TaxID=2665160 RepID=UPI0012B9FF3C|nr:GTPase HflX [Planomicrobium sp. YIM 101495]MTD31515.1 GTPase HflX [Planomicrobium sp. YIM 101495]
MEKNQEKAILVGVQLQRDLHFDYGMEELANLAAACELEVIGEVRQNLDRPTSSHYLGKGKVEELKHYYEELEANLIIFNDELTPSQIRNLEEELECKVIDRTMLILDIFSRRAKTREAQVQVELARLQYMLPRLVGLRASLSRQGGSGSGGSGGFTNRGAGETKLELDRRKIEEQISKLNKELLQIRDQRITQRKQREKRGMPVVSLVGYTNAGKSTVMNALLSEAGRQEGKQVFEKDMLFATLETSVREISLPDNKNFLLTDTVGFVSKLPHHLVKAFRSTLEEARNADLLLHVVDVASEEYPYMMEVTEQTLRAVGVEGVPTLYLYNKADLAGTPYPRVNGDSLWISAKEQAGTDRLLEAIKQRLFSDYRKCRMLIPFEYGDVVAYLNERATILETKYEENGTMVDVELSTADYERFREFIIIQ